MTGKSLARRLKSLEDQLLSEQPSEPIAVQIVYVSPDGSSEDGERFIVTNPGSRVPYGKRFRE
jgi:hypothetical protein